MARKLSLSDLTSGDSAPDWAKALRENRARRSAEREEAAQAEIAEPATADFSGVTSTADTGPAPVVPDENQGFWESRVAGLRQDIGELGGVVDALQAGGYRDLSAVLRTAMDSDNPYVAVPARTATLVEAALSGENPLDTYANPRLSTDRLQARAESNMAQSNSVLGPIIQRGGLEGFLAQTFQDAAQSGLSSAASLVGGPAAAVPAGAVTYSNSYVEAVDAGLSPEEAQRFAAVQGGVEALGSSVPSGRLLERVPFVGPWLSGRVRGGATALAEKLTDPAVMAAKRTAAAVIGEGAQEGATEVAQSLAAAAAAGLAVSDKEKQFLREQADLENLSERARRAAAAGALMGTATAPTNIRSSNQDFRRAALERANRAEDSAVDTARRVAETNAARPSVAPASTGVEAEAPQATQGELFTETTPGPTSTVPEPDLPQEQASDRAIDDPDVARERRNVLRNRIERERATIADLEQRERDAPLLREAGYDDFTPADAASLQQSRERLQALETALGNWEGGAAAQTALPLNEPTQPRPRPASTVQTRGGDIYYNPDGTQGSNLRDAARGEAEQAINRQAKADQAVIDTEYKYRRAQHGKQRKQQLDDLTEQSRSMPADERVDFITDGIRSWDQANPAIDKSAISLEEAQTAIAGRKSRGNNSTPDRRIQRPATTGTPVAAPVTPTTPPADPAREPVVRRPAAEGTVDDRLNDIVEKLSLGMQEQQANATPAEGAQPFDTDAYRSKIRGVVNDLSHSTTQGAADAINLINQGKLVLAPTPESVGRDATSDVAQYDSGEGRMYIYIDSLAPGDTTGAVIRAFHEATHAGQFNNREGRPDLLQQIMGKGPSSKAQATIRRAAANGNKLAQRVIQKARAGSRGDASIEDLEILPYFVGEVVQARGSTLGQLRGVANDVLSATKRFVGRATGVEFDVTMADLESAVSGIGREIVATDLSPSGDGNLSMIYPESAAGYQQALEEGRVYRSRNGQNQFVLTDADSSFLPGGEDMLLDAMAGGGAYTLGDIYNHPVLYANMPEARDVLVDAQNLPGNRMGQYWPGAGAIDIDARVLRGETEATPREVLLHEIQHWVQDQSNAGRDFFAETDAQRPRSERIALENMPIAAAANNAAAEAVMSNARRINAELPSRTAQAIGRNIINSDKLTWQKARELAELVDAEGNLDNPELQDIVDNFVNTLETYRMAAVAYNRANEARHNRYVANQTEAEAFTTQRNSMVPQDQLAINPETSDPLFGTRRGSEVSARVRPELLTTPVENMDVDQQVEYANRLSEVMAENTALRQGTSLGMAAEPAQSTEELTQRWAPAWVIGMIRADRGLSRIDNEIIEHAIASPAEARMAAEAQMGIYDRALGTLAADRGITPAQLNSEIQDAINNLPTDLTTHAENVEAFNRAVAPYGKAGDALKAMRDQTDDLTLAILQQRADSNIPLSESDKRLYGTLVENMGKYTHRQYASQAGKLGNKYAKAVMGDYYRYKEGKGRDNPVVEANYKKVAETTKFLVDNNLLIPDDDTLTNLGADQTRNLYDTWGTVGNPDGLTLEQMKQELADNRERINGDEDSLNAMAEQIAKELLGLAPITSPLTTYYRGGKQDMGILRRRQAIPAPIRELMGEITDPSMRLVMTVAKQAEFVARNRMLLELAKNNGGDLMPPGRVPPDGWTQLSGEGYGPLRNYWASPNMAAAIGDVQQQLATFEQAVAMAARNPRELGRQVLDKVARGWGIAAGTSKMLQVIWSPMNFVFNFVGGPMTMLTNGNINPANFARGFRSAVQLISYAINPKSATAEARRLVANDVVDSAFVGEIKNEQYRSLRKLVNEMAGRQRNPTAERVFDAMYKAGVGWKETYAMADVVYKIANFYHQVDVLTDFYTNNGDIALGKITPEQIDREAADVVKRTNFTYRRVAPILKAIEANGFSAFGPYMHEVFRTQASGVMQGIGEIQRAKQASTPEARNVMMSQGLKRLIGIAAAWGVTGMTSVWLSGITFGEDDEENKAKRALLPEYLRDQDFYEVGKDDNGYPVLFNVARFDPIGPATDIMRTVVQGDADAEELSKKMLDLYVTPRIGPQLVTAVKATVDPSVSPGRVPLVQELAPEQYSTLLDVAKAVGIRPSVAKAWTNAAETMYPGIANSWRSTNARPVSPDDLTTSAYNTATYLGMTLQSLDPERPVRFAAMDYTDSVRLGRGDLVEMFNDNPDRTQNEVLSQVLRSRNREKESFDDLRDVYRGAKAVGKTDRELAAMLKAQRLTADQIKAVRTGKFDTGVISASSLQQYEKRELEGKSKQEQKEIKQKWREINSLLKSTSRELNKQDGN